jgi:hypothetical protein
MNEETKLPTIRDSETPDAKGRCAPASCYYVAMLECSCGNESVGDMWAEAHVCTPETTIAELMQWKEKHPNGKRLSITQAT